MKAPSSNRPTGPVWAWVATNLAIALSFGILVFNTHADPLDYWLRRAPIPTRNAASAIAWGANEFVLLTGDYATDPERMGTIIWSSRDLITWTSNADILGVLTGLAYGDNTFVAVGSGWYGATIVSSSDGRNWSWDVLSYNRDRLSQVAFGNHEFVAVGNNYLASTVLAAGNGIGWTYSYPAGIYLTGVAYGNSRFLAFGIPAVGPGSTTLVISTDGIAWTPPTLDNLPSAVFGTSQIAFGSNTFVAVGSAGMILTSPDGNGWTNRVSGTSQPLYTIAYGNGTFVAVGGHGTILTSLDGVTWTGHPSGVTSDLIYVTAAISTFAVVGAGNIVLESAPLTSQGPISIINRGFDTNGLGLAVVGGIGLSCRLQSASGPSPTNKWDTLQTLNLTDGWASWHQRGVTGSSNQFFRVISP